MEEEKNINQIINEIENNQYTININTPDHIKYNKTCILKSLEKNVNVINVLLKEKLDESFYNQIVVEALNKGYIIGYNSPKEIKTLKYIKYAVEKGQLDALKYLIQEKLTAEELEQLDKLIYYALDKGLKINEYSPKFLKTLKYIRYAMEKGQEQALNCLDENTLIEEEKEQLEEIIYEQLKKGKTTEIIYFMERKLNNNFRFSEKIAKLIQDNQEIQLNFELLNYIKEEHLTDETKKIIENKKNILEKYGKINTLEQNRVFSYNLVKYIYPNFGIEICVNLLKYNTGADKQIINQIKENNIELIKKYYNNICLKIFKNSDKTIHYSFRYFDKIKQLIEDIITNNIVLNTDDLNNIKKIILNSNRFDINNYNQLRNYKNIIKGKINEIINTTNEITMKNYISTLFGYDSMEQLKDDFIKYDIDNFNKLNFIIKEIKKSKKIEENILKEYKLTTNEIKVIFLIKKLLETSNITDLKKYIVENELMDYSNEVRNIIEKKRKLYNIEFQTKLTDINLLKSKRTTYIKRLTSYKDINDTIGTSKEVRYEIIDMDGEKFNFLAHRLYHYDPAMKDFSGMLLNDPNLWEKLDGASTISTSSISDKGFYMIGSKDNTGVIYLFNRLTEDFMLYMKGGDLFLQHGGHVLEPSGENSFTDINALNQASVYKFGEFNEVAGRRENMVPCAIACVGTEPNDDQIRAASHFKIPIIRFNIEAYKKQNIEKYKKSKEDLKINLTDENIESIFLSGDIGEQDEEIDIKYEYCLNILKEKYRNKEIPKEEFIKKILYIELLLNRICENNNPNRDMIKKSKKYIKILCSIQKIIKEYENSKNNTKIEKNERKK